MRDADAAQRFEAVETGHDDVEQDQREAPLGDGVERELAVGDGDDVIALPAEIVGEDLAVARVVVRDQDGRLRRQVRE